MPAWPVLYDLDVEEEIPSHCTIEAWAPPVPAITEVSRPHRRLGVPAALPRHLGRSHRGLEAAAATLDRSVPHLVRSFTRQFGVSPHAYVIGRRIDAARRELLRGARPVEVATSVGFCDQAHFTRHFKRHTSMTPAGFARSHA
jgi:AraC-like DNA-binding protein